ncbi:DUF456 domain-containing protein [Caenibacillus caldisaponilyticus]|uniref:DUF456 domain-containing protein n=1 Tax=Caenibacillus caldisaponilyticus TaxID=1674942 RepID=UPI0009885A6C|nr:DUF456 domain-containing protein [Caenibacillus caldisaponilyticus]
MTDKDQERRYNGAIDEDPFFDDDTGLNDIYRRKDAGRPYDDDRYREETAAETAVDRPVIDRRRDAAEDDDREAGGTGLGWLAIVLSVVGLFFLPVIMGASGIIVGFIARRQGARALGAWAIGIGVAAIVISLFTAPFF